MKVWTDLERVPWHSLHTDNPEYGERFGYTVADVPAETVARWRRVQAEALAVHEEINVALRDAQGGTQ
jgi:hypothetical protein